MSLDEASTVTVERAYFETLLRRAQFNTSDFPVSQFTPQDVVTVCKAEFQVYQKAARQYDNLRRNLLRGGVVEETIALLSQDDPVIQDSQPSQVSTEADQDRHKVRTTAASSQRPSHVTAAASAYRRPFGNAHASQYGNTVVGRSQEQDWTELHLAHDDISASGDTPADEPNGHHHNHQSPPNAGRPQYDRQCTRTVQLVNLPEETTHADIAAVVRGGQVLDIYARSHDRSAAVSFVQAADARTFFDHARRHDLYVKNKRVEVRWNERQFVLAGHVASKIAVGATRNLVIRRCDPRITEANIREDLEHIHNLVIIKVDFVGGSCFIGTNSVHNAMFARTCMMSRLKFKGSKIDWDADECAQPLKMKPSKLRREPPVIRKGSANAVANRFGLLNVDVEDDDESTQAFAQAKETVGIVA